MCPSPVLPVLPNGRLPPTRLAPASLFRDLHIQKYVITPSKIGDWSVPSRPSSCLPSCTPSKNSKLMFPDQISRLHAHIFMLSYSCLHTFMLHVFMLTLSCFMLMPSYSHTLSSCPHTFMFMPSCSHGGLPCDGYRIYHWSLHPHDHVHVCQAAPRQKFPFMFPDQISSFHAHMFMPSCSCRHVHAIMPSCSCHHVPTGGSHVTAKIYHWSLHPHDHVHVCQAAPR